MVLALTNRMIDFAFAMLMLRILAPEGAGRYQFAVVFIGYMEILTRFGLGTLLTREVARDHAQGNKYLSNVSILRSLLWLSSLPLMGILLWLYIVFGGVAIETAIAVGLFAVGLWFSNISDGLTALFYSYEKAEYPAAISAVTTVIRASLGGQHHLNDRAELPAASENLPPPPRQRSHSAAPHAWRVPTPDDQSSAGHDLLPHRHTHPPANLGR